MTREERGCTWTDYHRFSLEMIRNREIRVPKKKRDSELISRISKCLYYLARRLHRK